MQRVTVYCASSTRLAKPWYDAAEAIGVAATRIADLRGRDAITLWARVEAGGEQAFWAFADLVAYNRADTVNLFELRDRLLLDLSDRLGMPDWFARVAKNESS